MLNNEIGVNPSFFIFASMESSQSSIQDLVKKIKEEMFSTLDPYSFVSPSAYDTAWLAMIPDADRPDRAVFGNCLDWVLNNQAEEGFWGESDGHGMHTIDCLPATLACMVALKTWNVGANNIDKGLEFIHANAEKLLKQTHDHCPRWFTIVFPAMLELTRTVGLQIVFSDGLKPAVTDIFSNRQQILETEELVDKYHHPPLLSYIEALPASYDVDQEDIVKHLSGDGSLFQSPSATARAFMATGNKECMAYLQSLVQRCSNGVPSMYPMDEELIKLCVVNHLQRLGLAEHFTEEIEEILTQVYRNYMNQQSKPREINYSVTSVELYKDSLAFRLLRMHGYNVSPWSFCWFLQHEEILVCIEENYEYFSSAMFNVYRATDPMFSGEYELQEARSLSRKLLEKTLSVRTSDDNLVTFPNFQRVMEHELNIPWLARLDHLDHRMWIEEKENNALWMGKTSKHRLSSLHNDELIRLAMKNYEFRQSIYKNELEELKRWSKSCGLSDMGFGREKTTYCYFAVAASSSQLPYYSDVRILVAKSAILITVADDFFDEKGSLNELESLTDAVRRWDAKGLIGHSKTIFDALDNLVSDIAAKHLHQQGSDITKNLRDLWYETFVSWLTEAKWSKSGCIPSMDEYLETGMMSIATHNLVLPGSCFLKPCLPSYKLRPAKYETLTLLLMVTARLLNDIQSYQREEEDGKLNLVLLYLKENPEADIEESIAYVREILDNKKKELVEHVLLDGLNDLPKSCKHFHLSCLKVFQMFFDSKNRFDSNTEMIQDIKKAIYIPIEVQTSKPLKHLPLQYCGPNKKEISIINSHFGRTFNHHSRRSFLTYRTPSTISRDGYRKMFIPPKFRLCFS